MKKVCFTLLFTMILATGCTAIQEQVSAPPTPGVPELFLKWQMFPDPRKETVHLGDEIVFKLTPQSTSREINKVTLFFGDGTSIKMPLNYTQAMSDGRYKCQPIAVSHRYKADNIYRPYVKYRFGRYPKDINKEKITFIIPPRVPSDDEIKKDAIQDSVRKLVVGIRKVLHGRRPSKVKFALTSAKNANFDNSSRPSDIKDKEIIREITTILVDKGYSVLEKNPQALIRLAHEAVVKRDKSGKPTNTYQNSLEYGLRTEYEGPAHPFVYGAEIEGVKSSDREQDVKTRERSDGSFFGKIFHGEKHYEDNSSYKQAVNDRNSANNKQANNASVARQNRALYFAKFATADYVVTIDRKENKGQDGKVVFLRKSKPIYYNTKYDTTMIERDATTKYSARILARDGKIVWAKDIQGEAKDRVVPNFVKASQQYQNGANFNLLKFFGVGH